MEQNPNQSRSNTEELNNHKFHLRTILIIASALLVMGVALGASVLVKPNPETAMVTNTPSDSPIIEPGIQPAQSELPRPSPILVVNSPAWITLESKEVGISFEYPSPTGSIYYEFHEWSSGGEPAGTIYGWEIAKPEHPYAKNTFIGGASMDFAQGRDHSLTDTYNIIEEKAKYFIIGSSAFKLEIHPIKIMIQPNGTKAFIFDAYEDYLKRYEVYANYKVEVWAAVLNFPTGYHPKLGSITFVFNGPLNLEDIEKVINSVKFLK